MTDTDAPAGPAGVLLAGMPFGHLNYPSIGLGLLKAQLTAHGIPCDVRHFQIDLVDRFMPGEPARALADYQSLATEWETYYPAEAPFARLLAPANAARARAALEQAPRTRTFAALEHLWEVADAFLDHCLDSVPWGRYRVVGFSTMFNQNLATLALAARLKERHPHLAIVLGGANTEDASGIALIRRFPQIDWVLRGNAEHSLPRLVRALLDGAEDPGPVPGLVGRVGGAIRAVPAEPVTDLDALPLPDYDDYFRQFRASRLASIPGIADQLCVPYETSRGCWWGERSHCTFCGLNGLDMGHRRKTPERVLADIEELVARHAPRRVCCVDNILHPVYFTTLFPALIARDLGVELSFEVKSNLKREHFAILHAAGIREIQPGIESLSTRVLGLMRKGSTMLDNVRVLRLAEEHGMSVVWLHLHDFPGERVADYEAVATLIPRLAHLHPPVLNDTRMSVRRFSPYFADPAAFGLRDLRPAGAIGLLYDLDGADIFDLAYRFDADHDGSGDPAERTRERVPALLAPALQAWRERFAAGADLSVYRGRRRSLVVDLRQDTPRAVLLDGLATAVMEAADRVVGPRELEGLDRPPPPTGVSHPEDSRVLRLTRTLVRRGVPLDTVAGDDVAGALAGLDRAGLLAAEDGRYLALAIPRPLDVLEQRLDAPGTTQPQPMETVP